MQKAKRDARNGAQNATQKKPPNGNAKLEFRISPCSKCASSLFSYVPSLTIYIYTDPINSSLHESTGRDWTGTLFCLDISPSITPSHLLVVRYMSPSINFLLPVSSLLFIRTSFPHIYCSPAAFAITISLSWTRIIVSGVKDTWIIRLT